MQPYQYGQPQYALPRSDLRRRFGAQTIAALVLGVVALIFIIISMVTVWWSLHLTMQAYGSRVVLDGGYTLGGSCASLSGGTGYSSPWSCSGFSSMDASMADVFHIAFVMMLLSLILAVLALVFLLIGALRPRLGFAGGVCGIVASILLLFAPIYVFAAVPGAFSADALGLGSLLPGMTVNWNVSGFFGSSSVNLSYMGVTITGESSYGGGFGWFAAFIAFILTLAAGISILFAMRALVPLGNYTTMPAVRQGYYQPQMGQWVPGYAPSQLGYTPQQVPSQSQYPAYGPQLPQTIAQPSTQPASPTPPSPPGGPTALRCPSCGTPFSAGQIFCATCGGRVG